MSSNPNPNPWMITFVGSMVHDQKLSTEQNDIAVTAKASQAIGAGFGLAVGYHFARLHRVKYELITGFNQLDLVTSEEYTLINTHHMLAYDILLMPVDFLYFPIGFHIGHHETRIEDDQQRNDIGGFAMGPQAGMVVKIGGLTTEFTALTCEYFWRSRYSRCNLFYGKTGADNVSLGLRF